MKREYGRFAWLVFSICIFLNSNSYCQKPRSRPNVLFISVDDLRPELGCYGKDFVKSPNLDNLASSGSIFKNHFAQVPTCGASRFCMLTGRFPRTRDHLKNDAIRDFISTQSETAMPETFIHHLRRNGYYTVGLGKIGHYPDGLIYEYTDPVSDQRELPYSWDELIFNSDKWKTGWNAFFGYADGSNRQSRNKQVRPYEKADVDDLGYPDGYTAVLALNKLEELAKRHEPFFLGVGFFKPHLPFTAPAKYWDLYNDNDIPLTSSPDVPDNVSTASLHGSEEFNSYQLGQEKASISKPLSDAYSRKVKHAYLAGVSYVDAQIGKILQKLEEVGLSQNTIVVVWGDHGWHLGEKAVWGKHTIFDDALRSTLIIKAPGFQVNSIDRVVSAVDIYPTLMELCNVAMPYHGDGKSMVGLMKNPESKDWLERSYGYYRNGISLRTDRYRLTRYFRDQEPAIELYDHTSDPDEEKNISGSYPGVVQELMSVLEYGDTGLYR